MTGGYWSIETTEHLKAVLAFKRNLHTTQVKEENETREYRWWKYSLKEDMDGIERELRTRGATLPV